MRWVVRRLRRTLVVPGRRSKMMWKRKDGSAFDSKGEMDGRKIEREREEGERTTRRTVSNSTASHSGRVLGVRSIEVFERSEVKVFWGGGVLIGGYLSDQKRRERGELVRFFSTLPRSFQRREQRKRAQKE